MKKRIIEIIKELKQTEQEVQKDIPNFFVSNDIIFSQALSCYRGEQAGKNKKENSKRPATKKQLDYLLKNNLDVNTENITIQEASKLIEEHINKSNGKKTKDKQD